MVVSPTYFDPPVSGESLFVGTSLDLRHFGFKTNNGVAKSFSGSHRPMMKRSMTPTPTIGRVATPGALGIWLPTATAQETVPCYKGKIIAPMIGSNAWGDYGGDGQARRVMRP
jgi:hypothetical protein